MKKYIITALLIITATFVSAIVLDEIVAKVGKDIILRSELEKEKSNLKGAGLLKNDISDKDILNSMIENKLILKYAEDNDYDVNEDQVKSQAEEQIKKIRAQFKSDEEFTSQLKKETGLSLRELKEFYIKSIREQKLKQMVVEKEIKSKVNVTEAEISEYYQENKENFPKRPEMDELGMIVRKIEPGPKTIKKKMIKIEKIKQELNMGEDFAELAKKYSEGPSATNGGDLGYFEKGMMVKPFEDAAFKLKKGEVSDVVRTRFGFHLIKVEDINGEKIRARHILIKVEPSQKDIENNKKLMDEALKKLRNGADFEEISKEYASKDTSVFKSGVIGDFPKDKYPELYKDKLKNLDYGQYSNVIKEDQFYIIFAKLKKVEPRPYTYDELYEKIRQKLMDEKEKKMYDEWISDQSKKNYIKILL